MKFNFVNISLFTIIVGSATFGFLVGGCKKESDVFLKFGDTANSLRTLLTELSNDVKNTTILSVDGSNPSVFLRTTRGVEVVFSDVNASFADESGAPVAASSANPIKFEVTDVFEKREITGLGTATQADFGLPLSSIAQVRIQAFLNEKPLILRDNQLFEVRIPVGSGSVANNVFVFEGGWNTTNSEVKFRWSQASDIPLQTVQPTPDGTIFYQISSKKMGWIAANQFAPNPIGSLNVSLENRFSFTNTHAFLVLNDSKSVFALPFDLTTKTFKNAQIPLEKGAKLVVFSKIGSQYFYGEQAIITHSDTIFNLIDVQKETTEAGLKAALQQI
jgi:hypothetical protein